VLELFLAFYVFFVAFCGFFLSSEGIPVRRRLGHSDRARRRQSDPGNVVALEQPTQQVWFREICLWQQEPQPWWDQVPGLMALSPLCRQKRPPKEVLPRYWLSIEG
jgi:hypothetical protein